MLPRFYLPPEEIRRDRATLAGAEFRHLARVLRLGPGAAVMLFDGHGREYAAEVRRISRTHAELSVGPAAAGRGESPLTLTLLAGLLKGARMDWLIEKATELGVDRILPVISARTVRRAPAADGGARSRRWRAIALAAAKQSGRAALPQIATPTRLGDALSCAADADLAVLCWEGEEHATFETVAAASPAPRSVAVAVGPEGGFTAEEALGARRAGWRLVRLAPRILRTETAAVVATALCQALWGDMRLASVGGPR